ncbi:MAG: MFS transporter [Alphaproteobacteria bacterium]|nr:MFS transporter [Alphaproteobacteria bacterium]MBL6936431.1 MFS transporter [Alphaproteobacteria bacterium]MBL7098518.1 MFS transporter [Alphaproteobacteria bacterium]
MSFFRPSGALWKHAGFLRLWAAQTVSSFGARIAREGFAMTAILSIHAAPWELGLLAAFARGPGIVVGFFAGGIVDRTQRRRVMIASDLVRVLLILTIPAAAWLGVLTMLQLYAVAALVGAASVFFDIADHAFLPSLIERENLLDGNAKLGVTDSIAEIGGPALAGTLYQLLTAPFAMLGTSLTYLVSALFLLTVPAKEMPLEKPGRQPRWYEDIAVGLKTVLDEPLVRPTLWMTIVFTGFGAFFSPLYLMYGLMEIGMSPALMGVTIAMGGVGALFGALLSTTMTRSLGVGGTVVTGGFLYAAFLLLTPLAAGPLWLRTAMMMTGQFGGDAFALAFIIPLTSLQQAVLPRQLLGRTRGMFSVANGAATVIGALVGGALGAWLGARQTLGISVAGIAAAPLFVVFSPLIRLKEIPGEEAKTQPVGA